MCRIAVITGTSMGLGYELCNLLHQHEYNIISGQRSSISNNNIRDSNIKRLYLDLNNAQSVQCFISYVLSNVPYINVLVNNAAIHDADWNIIMQVNLFSPIQLVEAFLPLMSSSRLDYRIINISSGDGELCYFREDIQKQLIELAETPGTFADFAQSATQLSDWIIQHQNEDVDLIFGRQKAYKFSKAALNAFTRFIHKYHHYSSQLCIWSICPGDVDTRMKDEHCDGLVLSSKDAALQIWPFLNLSIPCKYNGMFIRFGKPISW